MKLSDRIQIDQSDVDENLLIHVVKIGSPDESYKAQLKQLKGVYKAGEMLYVDSVYGNDSTAVAGSLFQTYLTPAAAQTAAGVGDVIVVRPGSYTVSSLGKNGVNWLLMAGVTFTNSSGFIFSDDESAMSFNVYGKGKLNLTAGEDSIIKISGGGTVNIECDEIYNIGGDARTIMVWGGSKLYINAFTRVGTHTSNSTGTNYELRDSDSELNIKTVLFNVLSAVETYSADPSTKFFLECDVLNWDGFATWTTIIYSDGGCFNVKAKNLVLNMTVDVTGWACWAFIFNSGEGEAHLHFDNVVKTDSFSYAFLGNLAESTNVFVKIGNTGTLENMFLDIVDGQTEMSGKLITSISGGPSILMGSGTIRLRNLYISNINGDADSVIVNKTGGNLVLDNVTIVLGDTANDDIIASLAEDVFVYSAVSNAATVNSNITELVNSITRSSYVF